MINTIITILRLLMLINRLIFFFLLSLTFSSSPSPNHSLQHSHWTNRRRRHSDWRSLRQYKFRWLRKRYSWSICAPYMPKWTIGFIVRSRRWLLNPLGLEHGVCPPPRIEECHSGKTDAFCDVTSDCLIAKGLDHAICRWDQCQNGQPGA